MSLREESPGLPGGCEIEGCLRGDGHYLVAKAGNLKRVCRRCGQEMTAMHGWTLIETRGGAHLRAIEAADTPR